MANQYNSDKVALLKLISSFTQIEEAKLTSFFEENDISMLFEHPTALNLSVVQLNKIHQLREIRSLYNNLNEHKNIYAISSTSLAGKYFMNYFQDIKDKERFICSFLNTGNNIITTEVLSEGSVNEAAVYPREIIKKALMYDAHSIIVSHNHPGGSTNPSQEDINITRRISLAASTVSIRLLDHIIVTGNSFYSFREQGYLAEMSMSKLADDYENELNECVEL